MGRVPPSPPEGRTSLLFPSPLEGEGEGEGVLPGFRGVEANKKPLPETARVCVLHTRLRVVTRRTDRWELRHFLANLTGLTLKAAVFYSERVAHTRSAEHNTRPAERATLHQNPLPLDGGALERGCKTPLPRVHGGR